VIRRTRVRKFVVHALRTYMIQIAYLRVLFRISRVRVTVGVRARVSVSFRLDVLCLYDLFKCVCVCVCVCQ